MNSTINAPVVNDMSLINNLLVFFPGRVSDSKRVANTEERAAKIDRWAFIVRPSTYKAVSNPRTNPPESAEKLRVVLATEAVSPRASSSCPVELRLTRSLKLTRDDASSEISATGPSASAARRFVPTKLAAVATTMCPCPDPTHSTFSPARRIL